MKTSQLVIDSYCRIHIGNVGVSISLLVYFSSRICIMNDEMIVRNASPREIQNAFIPANSPLSEEQQEMVKSFSMQSRMKLTWAQK